MFVLRRSLATPLFLLCFLLSSSGLAQTPEENFLILIADDLGVEKVKVYGEYYSDVTHDGPNTPNIDALAAAGIRFNQVWATPVCSSMRAATLTGKWPFRLDIGIFIKASSAVSLDVATHEPLPQTLKLGANPYSSAAVGKWHLGGKDDLDHPLQAGFDSSAGLHGNFNFPNRAAESFDYGGYLHDPDLQAESHGWVKVVDGTPTAAGQNTKNYATRVTAEDAIEYLSPGPKKLAEPWLLWVGFNAQHTPLHIPPSNLSKPGATFHDGPDPQTPPYTSLATTFDDPNDPTGWEKGLAMAEAMDHEIGRIVSALTATGEISHTTIIFIGDNGTVSFAVDPDQDPNKAKGTIYEGGVRVPLVIRSDRNITTEAGKSVDSIVAALDVFSTVTELANVTDPIGVDSISLVPFFTDTTTSVRTEVFSQKFSPNGDAPRKRSDRAIRNADYKLVRRYGVYQEFFPADANGLVDESMNLFCPDGASSLNATEFSHYDVLRAEMEALDSDTSPVDCSGGKDIDRDGHCDLDDHCPLSPDPANADTDTDGYGNACDADYSNDNFVGGNDFLIFRNALNAGGPGSPGWYPAVDFDRNGEVGGTDFLFFRGRYNKQAEWVRIETSGGSVPAGSSRPIGPSGTLDIVDGVQPLCD